MADSDLYLALNACMLGAGSAEGDAVADALAPQSIFDDVCGDFGNLADKCAGDMVRAMVGEVRSAAEAYLPLGQLWTSERVRGSVHAQEGGAAGAAGGADLSPSIVEMVEMLRDFVALIARDVHPDVGQWMWRDLAREVRTCISPKT